MVAFFKRYLWVWILVISLLLVPQSLNIQSELNMRVIVTALALDYKDNKYEVTAQVVKPKPGSTGGTSGTELDFISAEAESISDGIFQLSYKVGKTAGLGHISTIIMGGDLVKENKVISAVDFLVRDQKIPATSMLLVTEESAKDELMKTKSLEAETAVELQKLFLFKEQSMNGMMMQTETFFNTYYRIGSTGIISGFKINDESKDSGSSGAGGSGGGESSGGSSGGESSGGSGGEEKQERFEFKNDLYVFKNGNMVTKIDDEKALSGFFYANPSSKFGIVTLKNVTDEKVYNNATVGVMVRDKKVNFKTSFKDGKPVCKIIVSTSRNEVVEIGNENGQKKENLYIQKTYLTNEVVKQLQKQMSDCIKETFKTTSQAGADIFHLGSKLYRAHANEWDDFYLQYGEDYIKHIDLEVEIKIGKKL